MQNVKEIVTPGLKKVWRILPTSLRLVFWKYFGNRVRNYIDLQRIARPRFDLMHNKLAETEARSPLVIAGLFQTANGIGEAARSTYASLKAAGLSPIAVDLSEHFDLIDLVVDIPLEPMPEDNHGVLILQINGPETIFALRHIGMTRGRKWYTIGYWAWELPVFPKEWEKAFPFVSEIWTVSEFSANAIRQHKAAPTVSVFGHAVSVPSNLESNREKYGLPDDKFIYLVMADSMSSLNRKNPFVAIDVFKKSFGNNPDVLLVIKIQNLTFNREALEDIVVAIKGIENIVLIDRSLTIYEKWEFINSIDCLISLHRSEGYGLVLAESMALGKPVIATNWSGNTDFTTTTNSFLANYELVPCQDPYGVYDQVNAQWADISSAEAKRLMELVYENPSLRKDIAENARQYMLTHASPGQVGNRMSKKLDGLLGASLES